MDYPATQMFVDHDDVDEDEEEDLASSPFGAERNAKVGILVVDSITHPVRKGVNEVGRIETCSIIIDHSTISKKHAEIEAGADSKSIFISDLGSLNKTKLNDVILRPRRMYQLQDGDVLRFGSVQAIFKTVENNEEKAPKDPSKAKVTANDFVVPETPVSAAKKDPVMIPDTPDNSFEDAAANGSSTEGNNSSDISLIAGTQQTTKLSNASGLTVCDRELDKGEISIRSESTPKIDRKHPVNDASIQDISELETQNDSLIDDSDEENIFEMMTQQSDVCRDKTRTKFAADVAPESRFPSISDLETQKFDTDITPGSRFQSINDLETQKFGDDFEPTSHLQSISDLETQKFATDVDIKSHSRSMNGIERQKLLFADTSPSSRCTTIGKAAEHPISDTETQKFPTATATATATIIAASDDEDSETDEEGFFAVGGHCTNIFDAPTQLITLPDEESAVGISSDSRARSVTSAAHPCKETMLPLDEKEKRKSVETHVDDEQKGITEPETSGGRSAAVESASPELREGKRVALNDSVECKLNDMFDDVNDSVAEEPTQMLTQHLEMILESTQMKRHLESAKESAEPSEDGDAKSDSNKAPQREKESVEVFQIPEIMSTQEIFADLPFVNIRGTPRKEPPSAAAETRDETPVSKSKKSNKRESDRPAAAVDVEGQQKRKKNSPRKPRRIEGAERSAVDVPEAPKSSKKNPSPKVAKEKSAEMTVEEIIAVIHVPVRDTNRRKLKGSEEPSSTQSPSSTEEGATNQGEGINGKKLPPKKRGFTVSRREKSPAKMEPQIVKTVAGSPKGAKRPRVKKSETRANSRGTPTRLSTVIDPEEIVAASGIPMPRAMATRGARLRNPSSMIRVDYAKSESPTPLAAAPVRKASTGSRSGDQETPVVGDPGASEVKNKPEKPVVSRRGRKKALEESIVISDEELAVAPTPAKRSKRTNAASSAPAIADPWARPETPVSTTRGRGKRKNAGKNPRDSSIEESVDSKSGQSNGNGLSVRDRSARGAANNATKSPCSSNDATRFDIATQSSVESQEIQAILSEAGTETTRTSRFGYRSFLRVEKKIECDDMPAAKKRGGKVAANQTRIEEFLKPRAEPVAEVRDSPRTRGRQSIRGRRVVASSRAVAHPAEKENAVEEVARAKRGKKSGAECVASSDDESLKVSPLRRGRSSTVDRSPLATPLAKQKQHRILFTGLNDPQLMAIVCNLGGTITEKPSECTALVTDKVRRTYKFLCAMAMAVPIVPIDWLRESERRGRFLEPRDFLLQDPVEEAKFNFNLSRSLELAKDDRLLEGYTVVLTPNTAPPPSAEMKGLIQACGGKALVRPPTSWPQKSLVISRQEDAKNAKKISAKAPSSVPLVSVEFILTGILRHELNFKEHKLAIQ